MNILNFISNILFAASLVAALHGPHLKVNKHGKRSKPLVMKEVPCVGDTSMFLSEKTSRFAVNGSDLPEVRFNIGESYAGTLPISSNPDDPNQLWFWFFPSTNPLAQNEITIWLNGGPGCSSLEGLFQENGPFLWQAGTYEPHINPYAWTNLTNMIYIDQPISTGFSPGNLTVNNEHEVATHFKAFWKNFVDTFDIYDFRVYLAGESYAGQYIPYIASEMLDEQDSKYFDVQGILIFDPSINVEDVMTQAPLVSAIDYFQNVIGLNDTFMASIRTRAQFCGYLDFFDKFTTAFPPSGILPPAPSHERDGCDLFADVYDALYYVNPCFNIYHVTDYCPYLWNELGFPGLGGGPSNYFNRSDVQKVIHAPPTDYFLCGGGDNLFPDDDKSVRSALGPLPSVIERTNNTIIGHGMLDFLLFANGSIISIQNMTWNGLQGFQANPLAKDKNFYVPYHQPLGEIIDAVNAIDPEGDPFFDTAGAGLQGTWHTERGLTFVTYSLAGHAVPQYVPGAAYRTLEVLLGRVENLGVVGDFSTQTGNFTGGFSAYEVR